MSARVRWGLLGAALLATGAATSLIPRRTETPAQRPSADASARAVGWRWSALVESSRRQTITAGAPVMTMSLHARLDLDAHVIDATRVALTVVRLESFEARVDGKAVERPDLAGLSGQVEISPAGQVVGLAIPPGAPEAFAGILRVLLSEAQLSEGAGDAWEADEETESGLLHAKYSRTGGARGTTFIDKSWHAAAGGGVPFTRVAGGSRFALGPDGVIDELGAERTLLLEGPGRRLLFESHVKVELRRAAGLPMLAAARPPARREPSLPLSSGRSRASIQEEQLRQRVAGLTIGEVAEGLAGEAGLTGEARDRFLVRASGLLRLEPSNARALEHELASPALGERARRVGFEILASAGTPEAQTSMVALLGAAARRSGTEELALMERVIAVGHPQPELADYVESRMDGAKGFDRAAAAMVLGALGSRLEPSRQEHVVRELVEMLDSDDEVEAIGAVRGLGNVGSAVCRAPLLAQARASTEGRRRAAAAALRKLEGEEVEAALLSLATDASIAVQRTALETLSARPAHAPTLRGLAQAESRQRLGEDAHATLLNLVSRWQRAEPDLARSLLDAILGRAELPSTVRARALELRRRIAEGV